ncbi:MAG: hypothetical protein JNL65_09655 [Saprospiraceae bacterium]|nr:hypothetical protein [Saprospiraceae bacterium]HRG67359.1 hypothetical protein [Saprospiraceae bacterium]
MIHFKEKQKFTQWWFWLLIIGITCLFLFGLYQQLILKIPFGDNPTSDSTLVLISLIPILIIILFLISKLETEINELGVSYKFYPFHLSKKTIPWESIDKAYIRKYNPITEYGGWGFRLGLFGKGRALNMSGNMGLQLELKDGKKLLIGTQKFEELEQLLQKIKF